MVDLVSVGFLLTLAGVVAIFAATLRSSGEGGSKVEGGGVVLVGPVPIAFGTDARWTSVAIALAVVLVVLTLVLYRGLP